ncbi:MAG: DUF5804 family protein [Methanoregulaceae archaeon]|nr:DUF5804 family protein [Methanoregulaceae archaeon]
MKVLLFQREGISLLRTLLESETSRGAIRFYHPVEHAWGIEIPLTSLGSALALVSEFRWYIRRYVAFVLFRVDENQYCTHLLARQIYDEREEIPLPDWPFRKYYRIEGGKLVGGRSTRDERPGVLEVLCTEDEFNAVIEPLHEEIGEEDDSAPE